MPLLPISPATITADLRRTAENGRANFEAAIERQREEDAKKPYLRCAFCYGNGCYAEGPSGARRPMGADFRDGVDRYVGCCPECNGSKRVLVSWEKYVEARKDFLREKRAEYAAIRREVCRALGITKPHFDRLADRKRKSAPGRLECVEWVLAAKLVAAEVR